MEERRFSGVDLRTDVLESSLLQRGTSGAGQLYIVGPRIPNCKSSRGSRVFVCLTRLSSDPLRLGAFPQVGNIKLQAFVLS